MRVAVGYASSDAPHCCATYSAGLQLILKWLRRTEHRWNCDRDESEGLVHDIGYFAGWRSKERLNPPSHGYHRTFGPPSSLAEPQLQLRIRSGENKSQIGPLPATFLDFPRTS